MRLSHVWVRGALVAAAVRCQAALADPGFDFSKIPDDAARREIEAARKFATLLHLIDGRVGDRHDLAQFAPTDGSFDGLLAFAPMTVSSVGQRLVPMETDSRWYWKT